MKNSLVIPDQAIQTGQQGEYVYVLQDDSTVEMQPIQVEMRRAGLSVIREGLGVGDVVVTDGHLRLYPGASVTLSANLSSAVQAAGR
jgi:multidrug efflux system membrane fusion protein